MADSSNSRTAPGANPPPGTIAARAFDAGAWLTRFSDAGGWWIVGADDRISMGWTPRPLNPLAVLAARGLWREIACDADKRAAVDELLLRGTQGLPEGLPARYSGTSLHFAATRPSTTAARLSASHAQRDQIPWKLAMQAFKSADWFENKFRHTVFDPADAELPVGDQVGEAVERAMDAANDATDAARCIALRTPAPDACALRWKLEQFLVERWMPAKPAGEIDQVFADFDRLTAAGAKGVSPDLGTPPAAVAPPIPPVDDDAPLRAAWSLWLTMRDAYDAAPYPDVSQEELATIEAPYWEAIGTVEQAIAEAKATTPEGVAIKIKLALEPIIPHKDGGIALRHGRLDEVVTEDLEWHEKMLVDALRDLQAMSARLGA